MSISSSDLWLNINKPAGYSSAKIVAIVKRITKAKKVGHAGTLDPFAFGVLPIAINKATKTAQYVVNDRKKYFFQITWGEFRDSYDIDGKVTEVSDIRPVKTQLEEALKQFVGVIKQKPPRFSAIHVAGKRAYELARQDVAFELPEREITIDEIKLLTFDSLSCDLEVTCSKGTYIRSLAYDLCKEMKVCGYVSKLGRLEVGRFKYEDSVTIEELQELVETDNFFKSSKNFYHNLQDILDFVCEINLDEKSCQKFQHGQVITLDNFFDTKMLKVMRGLDLIGLAKVENNRLHAINVFLR